MQWLITTRPPNRKQVEMGIKSGNELLEKYRRTRGRAPSLPQRIWHSGIVYVMAGSMCCMLILQALEMIFKFDLPMF